MTNRILFLTLVCWGPVVVAQDYGNDKPARVPEKAVPLTVEQKEAIRAIDVRIGGIEALIPKIEDAKYKASVVASVADLKSRRDAQARNFDQMGYDALMQRVLMRYQVVALWLAPPRVPPPAGSKK